MFVLVVSDGKRGPTETLIRHVMKELGHSTESACVYQLVNYAISKMTKEGLIAPFKESATTEAATRTVRA